jgi:hypothetical protein
LTCASRLYRHMAGTVLELVGWIQSSNDWYIRARCRFRAFKSGIVGDTSELGTGRVDFERAALNCYGHCAVPRRG